MFARRDLLVTSDRVLTESPYSPPDPPRQRPESFDLEFDENAQRPSAVVCYNVYCVFMALVYFACVVGGVCLYWFSDELATDEDPIVLVIQGIGLAIIGGVLFLLFAAAPFLPRRKWAWIYGFFPIVIGMTSACCMLFSIPLLIFWVREDVKQYFRVRIRTPDSAI